MKRKKKRTLTDANIENNLPPNKRQRITIKTDAERKKQKDAERKRLSRSNETIEQRKLRLQKDANRHRTKYHQTPIEERRSITKRKQKKLGLKYNRKFQCYWEDEEYVRSDVPVYFDKISRISDIKRCKKCDLFETNQNGIFIYVDNINSSDDIFSGGKDVRLISEELLCNCIESYRERWRKHVYPVEVVDIYSFYVKEYTDETNFFEVKYNIPWHDGDITHAVGFQQGIVSPETFVKKYCLDNPKLDFAATLKHYKEIYSKLSPCILNTYDDKKQHFIDLYKYSKELLTKTGLLTLQKLSFYSIVIKNEKIAFALTKLDRKEWWYPKKKQKRYCWANN